MRANIELRDELLAEAREYSSAKTKRALVEAAPATCIAVKSERRRRQSLSAATRSISCDETGILDAPWRHASLIDPSGLETALSYGAGSYDAVDVRADGDRLIRVPHLVRRVLMTAVVHDLNTAEEAHSLPDENSTRTLRPDHCDHCSKTLRDSRDGSHKDS